MQNKVTIYSKDNCPYCVQAKRLLEEKGKAYTEINIGRDIRRDDFMSLFPNVRTVPFIIIDGDEIGGFDKLTEWLDTAAGRSFLAE
jgi:glutaredoxin 3